MSFKKIFLVVLFSFFVTSANSACFVDYKAKKVNPFKLHYGVIEIPSNQCTKLKAEIIVSKRIKKGDWLLLGIITLFDASGLEQRKESAGEYFLLY